MISAPASVRETGLMSSPTGAGKRLLLIPDRAGWSFDNVAKQIRRSCQDTYEVSVVYSTSIEPNHTVENLSNLFVDKDLVVVFYLPTYRRIRNVIPDHVKRIVLFFEEKSIDRRGFQQATHKLDAMMASNSRFMQKLKQRGARVPVFPCEDGVDTNMFTPTTPISANGPLRLLWTGNSHHGGKKRDLKGFFSIIQPAVTELGNRVELITRDSMEKLWPHNTMPEFYNSGDVVLCASSTEGTPNPVLEAAACGRSCISTDVGIVPEFVKRGTTGIIVAREVQAFVKAIKWCLGHRSKVALMGQQAREAAAGWSWDLKAAQYRTAFDAVVGTPKLVLPPVTEVEPPTPKLKPEAERETSVMKFDPLPRSRGRGLLSSRNVRSALVGSHAESVPAVELTGRVKGRPNVLVLADVPGWAFDQNLRDMAIYLKGEFNFDIWYMKNFRGPTSMPPASMYDVIFSPFHRWGTMDFVPMSKTLSSLRAQWFHPDNPHPPGKGEFSAMNQFAGFHVVTQDSFNEYSQGCDNVVYLTNPVDMKRFPNPTRTKNPIACWNGNAGHRTSNVRDSKGFYSIVTPACKAAGVELNVAEYSTSRRPPSAMPVFYQQSSIALCASLYEGACFVEGTPVNVPGSFPVPIEELEEGDIVLSMQGKEESVKRAWCEGTPDELIEITAWGGKKFLATKNHKWPVWAWKRMCLCGCGQHVTPGRLWVQNHSGSSGRKTKALHVHGNWRNRASSYKAIPPNYDPLRTLRSDELQKGDFLLIPRKFERSRTRISSDKARLLGYYAAEGSILEGRVGNYAVEFTFCEDEKDTWVADTVGIMKRIGVNATIKPIPEKHSLRVRTVNDHGQSRKRVQTLVRWLRQHAGEHALCKKLSPQVMGWSLRRKKELIKGLLRGDGHETWKIGERTCSFSGCFGSASPALAEQTQLLLAQLGYPAGIVVVPSHRVDLRKLGSKRISRVADFFHLTVNDPWASKLGKLIWGAASKSRSRPVPKTHTRGPRSPECMIDENFVYIPIKKLRAVKNETRVYNITVSGDHSYLVNNVSTYNSNSVMEAMASGLALIVTDVGNHREMQNGQISKYGNTGIVVVERNVEAFTREIRKLKTNPKLIREMGEINRKDIQENWSWEEWSMGYADFLRIPL